MIHFTKRFQLQYLEIDQYFLFAFALSLFSFVAEEMLTCVFYQNIKLLCPDKLQYKHRCFPGAAPSCRNTSDKQRNPVDVTAHHRTDRGKVGLKGPYGPPTPTLSPGLGVPRP